MAPPQPSEMQLQENLAAGNKLKRAARKTLTCGSKAMGSQAQDSPARAPRLRNAFGTKSMTC